MSDRWQLRRESYYSSSRWFCKSFYNSHRRFLSLKWVTIWVEPHLIDSLVLIVVAAAENFIPIKSCITSILKSQVNHPYGGPNKTSSPDGCILQWYQNHLFSRNNYHKQFDTNFQCWLILTLCGGAIMQHTVRHTVLYSGVCKGLSLQFKAADGFLIVLLSSNPHVRRTSTASNRTSDSSPHRTMSESLSTQFEGHSRISYHFLHETARHASSNTSFSVTDTANTV